MIKLNGKMSNREGRKNQQACVWGFGSGSRAGLKNAIRRLRVKIEPDPANPVYLLTGPGHGYRFRDR
jgi:DNA-binding response OmpR family regulator